VDQVVGGLHVCQGGRQRAGIEDVSPDYLGLSRDAATALGSQWGLLVDFQTIGTSSGTLVYSQNPGVGVLVRYGDTITLYMV
jgi:hypothetical protein